MLSKKIEETAKIYALQNAVQFNGKANEKAVIGKVIAALGKNGFKPKEIIPAVKSVVEQINHLSLKEQISELEKIAPDLLHREKKERVFKLPPLPYAEDGKVVTRFPPEPNGYLHIGHAKAAVIDHEYARMYNGKFILRFDDTNPENAAIEFYDAQREDLQWLGIEWDEEYNTSDHLKIHYQLAEQLIRQGDAYVCRCPPEEIRKKRFQRKECRCRNLSSGENIDMWNDMLSSGFSKGVILRLKGDLHSSNTAMHDPTLFRIIEKPHPIHGDRYHVWPTYDFAGAVEDSISGVTHPFRTKEYELRDECYFYILERLHLRKPHLMEFSRLSIKGMPVSKRRIKPLIEKGIVSGYDDIRLPTLRGLKRRGILPETIKQFVISQGISKVESTAPFSLVEAINRKILDPKTRRYFFVPNPVKIVVKNAPKRRIELKLHPTKDLGKRVVETGSTFYIPKDDVQKMKTGETFRLKELYNIRIEKISDDIITTQYVGEELLPDTAKIQWTTDDHICMSVFVSKPLFKNEKYDPDSLQRIDGYAEKAVADIYEGEIIQFERFGFVRIEKQNSKIVGFFAHK